MDPFTIFFIISAVVGAAGAMAAADAQEQAGQQRRVASEFEAAQREQAAGQEIAAAQRKSLNQEHQAKMLQSRALALAGASGGDPTDPSVVNTIATIAGEGHYRASLALYEGEDKARQLRMGAAANRYQGAADEAAGENAADATRISAVGNAGKSMYAAFGRGGPSGDTALIGNDAGRFAAL